MLSSALLLLASVVVMDVRSGRVVHQEGNVTTPSRPGSTLKPFVLQALERQGLAAEKLSCTRTLRIQGHRFDCAHGDLPTALDGVAAVAYSCNTWFNTQSRKLAPALLKSRLEAFGLGPVRQATTPDEVALQALGESTLAVSPLTLARAYRQLALSKRPLVMAALSAATDYGTARRAALPGLRVWGKTGTTSERQAWFAGFRADRVVVVRLNGGSGGADAAPLAASWLARRGTGPAPISLRSEGGVELLGLEELTVRVLGSEAGHVKSPEALKAMAVAARTYAVHNRGRHRKEGYDFCGSTHCQLTRVTNPSAAVEAAVEQTEGELLWYHGRPASVFYHRHCGGVTEAAGDVWPGSARPYLRSVQDTFCLNGDTASWRAELPKQDLARALGLRALPALAVTRRSVSGRASEMSTGSNHWSGEQFYTAVGRSLGWQSIKSTLYTVVPTGTGYTFTGKGSGHGVGMCQTGAALRGESGQPYRQILDTYFPGTVSGVTPQGLSWERRRGERVDLFVLERGRNDDLSLLADRGLREAERLTGLKTDLRPRVRVYPSVALYRDATGEPGWVAGVTRGENIAMQPVTVLRERGMLESTLLHEMVHVLMNTQIGRPLPEWFEEGLALCLSRSPATDRGGYRSARDRVAKLLAQYGQPTVMGWLKTGVPSDLAR